MLICTGPGILRLDAAGLVVGQVWNQTDQFLQSNARSLAGYPDPLLTPIMDNQISWFSCRKFWIILTFDISGLVKAWGISIVGLSEFNLSPNRLSR